MAVAETRAPRPGFPTGRGLGNPHDFSATGSRARLRWDMAIISANDQTSANHGRSWYRPKSSLRLLKPAPRSAIAAIRLSRSRVDLASRSSRVTTSTSPGSSRPIAFTNARREGAPDCPLYGPAPLGRSARPFTQVRMAWSFHWRARSDGIQRSGRPPTTAFTGISPRACWRIGNRRSASDLFGRRRAGQAAATTWRPSVPGSRPKACIARARRRASPRSSRQS
jgi:hypothetical protein